MPMHKVPNILLPVFGLCLLAAGPLLRHQFIPSPAFASQATQQNPIWANPNRRVILYRQYQFYQRCRHQPEQAKRAAAFYNQCVADSNPSALHGTDLPGHLP